MIKNHTHQQSNFSFYLMSIEFRFRDWLHPPATILQEAGVGPGMTVLDFGCGPGGFSLAAARLVGAEGHVDAVDIHPLAVKSVQNLAVRHGLRNVRAFCGDIINGMGKGGADIALLYDVLHDLPQPDVVLAALHRALKPHGVLSVSDHHLKDMPMISMITGKDLFRLYGRSRWTFQFGRNEALATAS